MSLQPTIPLPLEAAAYAPLKAQFREHGFVFLKNVVPAEALAALSARIVAEFERARQTGSLFVGGGRLSGHLNCFPGAESRFVFQTLEKQGVIDFVRALSPTPLSAPNIGCNLNLPGSSSQNEHVDGYVEEEFLVVNVAAVDTDLRNGAMEILTHTHDRDLKYWQIMTQRPARIRLCMSQGDVVIRTSRLWHRGMSNPSSAPRPMLAFTWEHGGSTLSDPYQVHGGKITFLPNRYQTSWRGRVRERMFVAAPGLSSALRAAQSLFE